MRIVLLGKTLHGESLPALADSLDDEGFLEGFFFQS